MPHTLVVVMILVIVAWRSWVFPGRASAGEGGDERGARRPSPALTAKCRRSARASDGPRILIKGFDGALLICFLIIGGSFAIFQETGAVEFGIRRLVIAITRARTRGVDIPT
jgi:uncharacterized ion transporter superfamily protein YfcC